MDLLCSQMNFTKYNTPMENALSHLLHYHQRNITSLPGYLSIPTHPSSQDRRMKSGWYRFQLVVSRDISVLLVVIFLQTSFSLALVDVTSLKEATAPEKSHCRYQVSSLTAPHHYRLAKKMRSNCPLSTSHSYTSCTHSFMNPLICSG